MSYAFYIQPNPFTGKPIKRGYGVSGKCHQRGCGKKIDRGLSYLCYSCTWYFCGEHLTVGYDDLDKIIETDCFAGRSSQICFKCEKELSHNE